MSETELKTKLHESIDQIDDNEWLHSFYDILQNGNKLPGGLLTKNEFLSKLDIGMDDINNGRTISLKDSNKKIDEWLLK